MIALGDSLWVTSSRNSMLEPAAALTVNPPFDFGPLKSSSKVRYRRIDTPKQAIASHPTQLFGPPH
jgi:hypothetical protein